MGGISLYKDGVAVIFVSRHQLNTEEISSLFGKFGKIESVTLEHNRQIINFQSEKEAKHCVESLTLNKEFLMNARNIKEDPSRVLTGDTILNIDVENAYEVIKKTDEDSSKHENKGIDNIKNVDNPFLQNCCSPVLLNIMDPGFRLAYCHDVSDIKVEDVKPRRLHQFNRSIKKYMDNTPKIGSQELVLTNLPPNFKVEDVYQLCGQIQLETVELKTTSNANILYANVKAKNKNDFEKLTQVLENRQINGIKITTIPITKITQSFND